MQGFLGASIFSRVLGTLFPGEGTIYLKQTLDLVRPRYVEENYEAVFVIKDVKETEGKANIETTIRDSHRKVTIKGQVLVLNKEKIT